MSRYGTSVLRNIGRFRDAFVAHLVDALAKFHNLQGKIVALFNLLNCRKRHWGLRVPWRRQKLWMSAKVRPLHCRCSDKMAAAGVTDSDLMVTQVRRGRDCSPGQQLALLVSLSGCSYSLRDSLKLQSLESMEGRGSGQRIKGVARVP